jgi:hypothetical protein
MAEFPADTFELVVFTGGVEREAISSPGKRVHTPSTEKDAADKALCIYANARHETMPLQDAILVVSNDRFAQELCEWNLQGRVRIWWQHLHLPEARSVREVYYDPEQVWTQGT